MNNFITKIVEEDIENGVYSRKICTRFPPEPNGYLHIGSVYAINISHTIAKEYDGYFNLRFDDTNPLRESIEYVNAIIEDMKWAGYDPGERIFYGSDYSEIFYERAELLIRKGKAYVCDLDAQQIREHRGTLTQPGTPSPFRERSVEENLNLFRRMRAGEFESGAKTLRAKIDMSSPNINLRDPVIYRIQHAEHYRTKNEWCIYPMYDYAHPLQDAIEGITHSCCSIEFAEHRALYEWFLVETEFPEPPKQREFGRINITGAVTSKRYLRQLVLEGHVDGWNDPRLPTIQGLRRRGFTPESIRNFVNEIGVGRGYTTVDISMLEHFLRQDLKSKAPVVMTVLRPLEIEITNYPEDETEYVEIENNAENEELGKRMVPFSRKLYVEADDFMEEPIKGFNRLYIGNEVRLKGAYYIKCNDIVKDETGKIIKLLCTYDPETKSGSGFNGRKVKGTIHWVSAGNYIEADVHLYNKLLDDEELLAREDLSWEDKINKESRVVLENCLVEKAVEAYTCSDEDKSNIRLQFLRHGYFVLDSVYTDKKLVFNRIVSLKDSWKPQ